MNRDYVIVSTTYGLGGSCLMFWGEHTQDDAERRSFGGYTRNLDGCEKYTKEELDNDGYNFPYYEDGMYWNKYDNYYIKISDLEKLGRKFTVIYI